MKICKYVYKYINMYKYILYIIQYIFNVLNIYIIVQNPSEY